MNKPAFFLLFILGFFSPSYAAPSGEAVRLNDENRLLEAELKMARKPKIYFVMDLEKKKFHLKCRGVLLKEMDIEGARLWGKRPEITPRAVLKRSALLKPGRHKIEPVDGKEDEDGGFEVEALELKDMPSGFRIRLEDGAVIAVRSNGLAARIRNAGYVVGWYASRPLLTVWNFMLGRPFSSFYITMSKKDARTIYWSCYEGMDGAIRPSAD